MSAIEDFLLREQAVLRRDVVAAMNARDAGREQLDRIAEQANLLPKTFILDGGIALTLTEEMIKAGAHVIWREIGFADWPNDWDGETVARTIFEAMLKASLVEACPTPLSPPPAVPAEA